MHRISVAITAAILLAGLLLLPVGAVAAEPLPAGTYEVVVDEDIIRLLVDEHGASTVESPEGYVVTLSFDEEGRTLDRFTVDAGDTAFDVSIVVTIDGSSWAPAVRRRHEPLHDAHR